MIYQCFFNRYVGDVAELVVIEARDDARVLILADDHMADHPGYASVEIFEDERRVAFLERPGAENRGRVH